MLSGSNRCVDCGATVSTGGPGLIMGGGNSSAYVLSNSELENTVLTQNGTYVLPNGIIVLVGADIEAYLNGELQFE